jgi:hypothetical protein
MARITSKFKLNAGSKWPEYQEICRPMVLESKTSGATCVAIRTGDCFLIFHEEALTYCGEVGYMEDNYTFIRYLGQDETVTFSGTF